MICIMYRNAEACKERESEEVNRRPRIKDMRKGETMRAIEIKKEMLEIERNKKEIWED